MKHQVENQTTYDEVEEALHATSGFYRDSGFQYSEEKVAEHLAIYIRRVPCTGNVLDLCCGDGVWSKGIKALNPRLALFGIDIAPGAIESAQRALQADAKNFVVGDAEQALPWQGGTFDLIFARGPGLFNQHSMDRPATIEVIERWHRLLKPGGVMISMFYSDPERFGTSTNPLEVALPYNRAPRLTATVDFTGGKYHHDIASFLCPFRKARNVKMGDYRFVKKTHILESRCV